MSLSRIFAVVTLLALTAAAQEGKPATRSSAKYENKELRLSFAGVYGWASTFAEGAGAWSDLAGYSEPALDAQLRLQVSSNAYGSLAELRRALEANYVEGGTPAPGSPAYKEVTFQQVEMRRGAKLPGIEVSCYMVGIDGEGKKREKRVLSRVYMGKERLYRIHCTVRRSRAKRVEDLFVRALSSLRVDAAKERVSTGTIFQSGRGRWSCTVPDGFKLILPPEQELGPEMVFEDRAAGLKIEVFALDLEGVLDDCLIDLEDEYGDDIVFVEDEVAVLGKAGFAGTVTKGSRVTLISGTLSSGILYRIQTSSSTKKTDQGREIHTRFLKNMKLDK